MHEANWGGLEGLECHFSTTPKAFGVHEVCNIFKLFEFPYVFKRDLLFLDVSISDCYKIFQANKKTKRSEGRLIMSVFNSLSAEERDTGIQK